MTRLLGLISVLIGTVLSAPQSEILPMENKYLNQPLSTETNVDVGLSVIEMIQRRGYPAERHSVQTADGYILEMHRIPYGQANQGVPNKPVAFLMHGLLSSSADWIMMGPEKGLAYILADLGFDVWMGNARGNTWSRRHIYYNPDIDQAEFWSFSWHEIGYYDLPAMIDHTLANTGQSQVFYVGHSQGTTAFFVMASQRPAYNQKIRLMSALAPVAFMSHIPNPFLRFLANFDGTIEFLAGLIGLYEFLPNTAFITGLSEVACSDRAIFQEVCSGVLFLIMGFDSAQLNRTMIPVILSHSPAGASTKQLLHYAQEINSGYFRKYDYGWFYNLWIYGSFSPPRYDLSRISAPVALYYSDNDWLVAITDVQILSGKLPHRVLEYLVGWHGFNHLDFLWAIDVVPLLYDHVINLMWSY